MRRGADEILQERLDSVDDGVGEVLHCVENFVEETFDLVND